MLLCKSRSPRRDRSCYFFAVTTCFRSFGFELQGRCSAFTSWRARKRDPKTFSLAAHNQEFVLGHVTFVLQQLFQISLERGLCFNHRTKDFFTSAGKSSASMFCHFNSSRAITLLQLGQKKGHTPLGPKWRIGHGRRRDQYSPTLRGAGTGLATDLADCANA